MTGISGTIAARIMALVKEPPIPHYCRSATLAHSIPRAHPMTRILLFAFLCSAPLPAQTMVLSNEARADFHTIRSYVTRAAEKMPADKYDYRPVPEVCTFGQIIAHVADDQYNFGARRTEARHPV